MPITVPPARWGRGSEVTHMTMKHSGWRTRLGRGIPLALTAGILFAGPVIVLAQAVTSSAAAPPVGTEGKPLTFDVVSVREDQSEPTPQKPVKNGPTADGYRLKGLPLIAVIQRAYIPLEGGLTFRPYQITGLPAAFDSIRYDIYAKISEADLPKWKDPTLQPAMLRAMLQGMLADRFKLAVHRETRDVPIYELTVGRKSPKFKRSEATALADVRQKHPNAVTLRSGTIVATGPNPGEQTLFGVTMPDLGTFLSTMAGRPIHDKTGLTGKYDITYELELSPPAQERAGMAVSPDFFSSQIFSIVQDQLGLKLRAAKGLVESLVIDHLEQPSEN
jgi:bla regulator protein blaR1